MRDVRRGDLHAPPDRGPARTERPRRSVLPGTRPSSAEQSALDLLRDFRPKLRAPGWRRLGEPLDDDRLRGGAGERRLPGQHLVQHATEGVDVAPAIQLLVAGGLLRTHVRRRADRGARLSQVLPLARTHRLGDPEIGHHGLALVEHHVLGLDVAVDHALRVGIAERGGDVAGDSQRLGDGQLAFPRQPVPQAIRPRRTA